MLKQPTSSLLCNFMSWNKFEKINTNVFIIFLFFGRMMYWTSGSYYSSRIEKAEMTGKERVVLSSSYWNFYPNGLTLDQGQNRLYWVDRRYHKLEYLDLNLNIRVNLISSYDLLRYPFGLALLGDHLYWTDLQLGTVYRANKTGGSVTKFVVNIGQPRDIQGYNVSEHATPGKRENTLLIRELFCLSRTSLFVNQWLTSILKLVQIDRFWYSTNRNESFFEFPLSCPPPLVLFTILICFRRSYLENAIIIAYNFRR